MGYFYEFVATHLYSLVNFVVVGVKYNLYDFSYQLHSKNERKILRLHYIRNRFLHLNLSSFLS